MFEAPERKGETVMIDAPTVTAHLDRMAGKTGSIASAQVKISKLFSPATAGCSRSSSSRRRPTPGVQALERTIRELGELQPAFVSVTYGAGGSTRTKTIELVQWIRTRGAPDGDGPPDLRRRQPGRNRRGASTGWSRAASTTSWCCGATPPPASRHSSARPGGFAYAADLVDFIRKRFGGKLCLGGAGNPEGHVECRDLALDITQLKAKVDAGLDFVVTQLFFDNRVYFDFVARARAAGIKRPDRPGADADSHGRRHRAHDRALSGASIPRRCAPSWNVPQRTTPRSPRWASRRPPRRPSNCSTAARPASTSTRSTSPRRRA